MSAQPDPEVWAQCPRCKMAWVLRRSLTLSKGWQWLWSPDCKHPDSPVLADARGPIQEASGRRAEEL